MLNHPLAIRESLAAQHLLARLGYDHQRVMLVLRERELHVRAVDADGQTICDIYCGLWEYADSALEALWKVAKAEYTALDGAARERFFGSTHMAQMVCTISTAIEAVQTARVQSARVAAAA